MDSRKQKIEGEVTKDEQLILNAMQAYKKQYQDIGEKVIKVVEKKEGEFKLDNFNDS